VEHTVEDSLKRAQNVLNLTISSAENIRRFHPKNLDPNQGHQTASFLGAGWVMFALLITMVAVLIWYCIMVLKGMRGQLDLDMDTIKGNEPRNKLQFTNPFNQASQSNSSGTLAPSHVSYGRDLTPSGSDMVISDDASDGDSVNIPI